MSNYKHESGECISIERIDRIEFSVAIYATAFQIVPRNGKKHLHNIAKCVEILNFLLVFMFILWKEKPFSNGSDENSTKRRQNG